MSSLAQAGPGTSMAEILAQVRISEVYCALTGERPRRVGSDNWRARAVWRGGDGLNVSLNDNRNVWRDFAANEGGGVLDLVVRISGGTRRDALHWLAEFAGVPLEKHGLSPRERADWAEQQRQIQRELPKAKLWQRAAVALGEEVLDALKAGLSNPKLPWPGVGEIAFWTRQISKWRRMTSAELVGEYLWWADHHPRFTAGMIYGGALDERAQIGAVQSYLGSVEPGGRI